MGICPGYPGKMIIITELYATSLDKLLFSERQLPLPLRMSMALDVAQGIELVFPLVRCN